MFIVRFYVQAGAIMRTAAEPGTCAVSCRCVVIRVFDVVTYDSVVQHLTS